MHRVKRPEVSPLIVSVSGAIELSTTAITSIRSGILEPEGAFARFAGTCHTLSPQWFDKKQLEAHEAFWNFDNEAQSGKISGELAWFQIGVYSPAVAILSVPLIVHAGVTTLEQLGSYLVSSVRVQVPPSGKPVNQKVVHRLVDQFAALVDFDSDIQVEAKLISRACPKQWESVANSWCEKRHTEPFKVLDVSLSISHLVSDDRWSFRSARSACSAVFSVPEWSPSVASTIVILMIEAGRAAGINETVSVDVEML